jgi:hypothetical protein
MRKTGADHPLAVWQVTERFDSTASNATIEASPGRTWANHASELAAGVSFVLLWGSSRLFTQRLVRIAGSH